MVWANPQRVAIEDHGIPNDHFREAIEVPESTTSWRWRDPDQKAVETLAEDSTPKGKISFMRNEYEYQVFLIRPRQERCRSGVNECGRLLLRTRSCSSDWRVSFQDMGYLSGRAPVNRTPAVFLSFRLCINFRSWVGHVSRVYRPNGGLILLFLQRSCLMEFRACVSLPSRLDQKVWSLRLLYVDVLSFYHLDMMEPSSQERSCMYQSQVYRVSSKRSQRQGSCSCSEPSGAGLSPRLEIFRKGVICIGMSQFFHSRFWPQQWNVHEATPLC